MKVTDIVQALINVSEKGANIARIIRSESTLLDLLVQEKTGNQKNQRFVQDFKTLADVLVQEMVRHDLSEQFPGISDSIYGEESNKFTNALGESIVVEILSSKEATSQMLSVVLDNNTEAAELLADVVHKKVHVDVDPDIKELDSLEISVDNVGVWIDPIDSTAQYIDGSVGECNGQGIVSEGLQCVTVLIGVYSKTTGIPLIGVTNQPFATYDSDSQSWHGNMSWGVCLNGKKIASVKSEPTSDNIGNNKSKCLVTSSSESQEVQEGLSKHFTIHHSAGAGYKFLCVFDGKAEGYVLSKSSTYKWDACGPHAILLASGGGLIYYNRLKELLGHENDLTDKCLKLQVRYDQSDSSSSSGAEKWCNKGGIIAYRSNKALIEILKCLQEVN